MIVVKLKGGLGNQMFQYAFGRFLSIKNNDQLILDTTFLLDRTPLENVIFRDYDLDIFNLKVKHINLYEVSLINKKKYALLFNKWLKPVNEKVFNYDSEVLNLPRSGAYFDGYWQTEKYFNPVEKIIKEDFRLKNELLNISNDLYESIISSDSVCLNFRRTDFVNNSLHGVTDENYYDRSISYIAERIKNPVFFIFSDDIEWCRQNVKIKYPCIFAGKEHAGRKFDNYLRLMTACKNFIIPNSSFGWWAAWLSENQNKIIIAPAKWFNDFDGDTKDLIPERWIKM
ncbi:MAG: alpha-1,2-fucosyltransferase [Bacteroidota bacterium]